MSHKASAWAISQLPDTPYEKVVLMVLADFHNNESGLCYPAAKTVGNLCRCNEKTVRNSLKSLQAQGFIWMHPRRNQTPLIEFNWARKGADSGTAPQNSTAQSHDSHWPAEDQKEGADSGTAPREGAGPGTAPGQSRCGTGYRGVRTPTPMGAVPGTDEPGINLNNINKDEIYRISKDWIPDPALLQECLDPEIPDDFTEENTRSWINYRTEPTRAGKERSHQIWHEVFAKHIENRWGHHKKKNKIEIPTWQANGFDSPEAADWARDLAQDKKMFEQLVADNKPIPKYLKHFAEASA